MQQKTTQMIVSCHVFSKLADCVEALFFEHLIILKQSKFIKTCKSDTYFLLLLLLRKWAKLQNDHRDVNHYTLNAKNVCDVSLYEQNY